MNWRTSRGQGRKRLTADPESSGRTTHRRKEDSNASSAGGTPGPKSELRVHTIHYKSARYSGAEADVLLLEAS